MTAKPYIIYHKSCMDGAGAALAAWYKFGDSATYWFASYNDAPPPDDALRGCDVYVLDFSYPRDVLEKMSSVAASVTVIDHHKTAKDNLAGFPRAVFDTEQSGAMLAWHFFHGGKPVPALFEYIQDRDLWRWELSESKAVSAFLGSLGAYKDFYELLKLQPLSNHWVERAVTEGHAILRYQEQSVESAARSAVIRHIGGLPFYVLNATMLVSEIGHALCAKMAKDNNTGIGRAALWRWNDQKNKYIFSLRAVGDVDISDVAKQFGGGGHPHASGFECTKLPWM